MQKMETDKLYIVGLFMITDIRYDVNDGTKKESRFLKWIVVENESDDYAAYFKDIKTGVHYFSQGFDVGDLFIEMDTIVSMNTFTHKAKLSKEEVGYYLKTYKENDNLQQIRDKRIILDVMRKALKALGTEKAMEIIYEIMYISDEECPKNIKEFLNEISVTLGLDTSLKKKYKKKGM